MKLLNIFTLFLITCLSFTVKATITTDQQTAINQQYPPSSVSETISSIIPRVAGSPDPHDLYNSFFNSTGSLTTQLIPYGISIGIYFAIGILFAIITGLTSCCFCCCRYGCDNCGGKYPRFLPGYSDFERSAVFFPALSLLLISSGIGIASVVYFQNFTTVPEQVQTTVNHAGDSVVALGTSVNQTLEFGISLVDPTVANVLNRFQQVENTVSTGSATFVSQLARFGNNLIGINITIYPRSTAPSYFNATTYLCSDCTSLGNQVLNFSKSINSTASSFLSTMNSTITSATNSLNDIKDQIHNYSDTFTSLLNTVVDNVHSIENQEQMYINSVTTYRLIGNIVLSIILLLPILILLCHGSGGCMMVASPFILAFSFAFLMMIVDWFFFGLFMPMTIGISDVCSTLDHFQMNLNSLPVSLPDQALDAVSACLLNTSLLNAFNISLSQFNLTQQVINNMPSVNLSSQVDWSTFDQQVASSVNITDKTALASFNFSDNINNQLLQLNNLTAPLYYTIANLSSLNDSALTGPTATTVLFLKYTIFMEYDAELAINGTLAWIHSNTTALINLKNAFQANVSKEQDLINGIPGLFSPFDQIVTNLSNLMYCSFLGDFYRQIKNILCNTIPSDLGLLSLFTLAMAIFGIPITVLIVISSKRIPAPF